MLVCAYRRMLRGSKRKATSPAYQGRALAEVQTHTTEIPHRTHTIDGNVQGTFLIPNTTGRCTRSRRRLGRCAWAIVRRCCSASGVREYVALCAKVEVYM